MKKKYICKIFIVLVIFTAAPWNAHSMDTLINGFVAQGYLKTDRNNFQTDTQEGSFEFNEMGIKFSSAVSDNLFLGMQFFARDLGNLGNDDISIDWAYADYIFSNALGLRAGKIKIPFGFYNESRDSDMLRTAIFLPSGVYSEPWRDSLVAMKGAGIYGNIFNYISYQIQTGTSELPLDGGLVKQFMGIVNGTTTSFTTENFSIINLQVSEFLEGLRFGLSYYYWSFHFEMENMLGIGLSATSDGDINTWCASVEYIYNRLLFSAEYSVFKYDSPINVIGLSEPLDPSTESELFYVNFSYQITDYVVIGIYQSVVYGDRNDRDGKKWADKYQAFGFEPHTAYSKDSCLSLRFDLNPNWIVKVEGHYFDGTATAFFIDNQDENGNIDLKNYWHLFAVKFMYIF